MDDEKFLRNFWDGVIFNLVSKVNRYYFGFPFLHFVIGPQNSHHSLNQSDAKLKQSRLCHSRFRALQAVCLFQLGVLIGY